MVGGLWVGPGCSPARRPPPGGFCVLPAQRPVCTALLTCRHSELTQEGLGSDQLCSGTGRSLRHLGVWAAVEEAGKVVCGVRWWPVHSRHHSPISGAIEGLRASSGDVVPALRLLGSLLWEPHAPGGGGGRGATRFPLRWWPSRHGGLFPVLLLLLASGPSRISASHTEFPGL